MIDWQYETEERRLTAGEQKQRERHLRAAEQAAVERGRWEEGLRFGRVPLAMGRREARRLTAEIARHYAAAFELEVPTPGAAGRDPAWWARAFAVAARAEEETAREVAAERRRREVGSGK